MQEFQTIERAFELFRNANYLGNQNCIFVAMKDYNHASNKMGVAAGVGGLLGAAISSQIGKKDAFQNMAYDGFLINKTESGIALIPLNVQGVMWKAKTDKLFAYPNSCFFFRNDEIESIKIKNFALINSKIKSLKFKFTNGYTLYLMVCVKDKFVSYHERNFAEFMSYYNNK